MIQVNNFAYKFFPPLYFDQHEPFLPIKIGFTIYSAKSPSDNYQSPAFPRPLYFIKEMIGTESDADTIIEYSLLYEADISHLYELEHLWVYTYGNRIIKMEGSRHGLVINLIPGVNIFVEPGKHGHFQKPLTDRLKNLLNYFCSEPGSEGLQVNKNIMAPELQTFKTYLALKYKNTDINLKVKNYLSDYKIKPSFVFSKKFNPELNLFVTWDRFKTYIKSYLKNQLNSL